MSLGPRFLLRYGEVVHISLIILVVLSYTAILQLQILRDAQGLIDLDHWCPLLLPMSIDSSGRFHSLERIFLCILFG